MANNEDNEVARDQAIKEAAIEAKLNEEKNSAANRASQQEAAATSAAATPTDSSSQEAGLTEQKAAQNNKPSATEQLEDVALDMAKKQIKKRIWLWLAGLVAGTSEFWIPALIILIVLMTAGITYNYWTKHKYSPTLYYQYFTGHTDQLLQDAITDAINSEYSGSAAKDDDAATQAPTAAAASGQSDTGARTPENTSVDKNTD